MYLHILHSPSYRHTCVQVPIVQIPSLRVCQNKCLHAPLCWLLGHVLNEAESPFEGNHALINTHLFRECVLGLKISEERLKEGAELEEWIMSRLPFLPILAAVIEVEEAEDQTETIPLHDLYNVFRYMKSSALHVHDHTLLSYCLCVYNYYR